MPVATARIYAVLSMLPIAYVVAGVLVRAGAGPFWQWNLLDPAYFYLLDSLNLVNGSPPGHMAHPGITVDSFGAVMLALAHFSTDPARITSAVLAAPEPALQFLSTAYLILNGSILLVLGRLAYGAFGALVPALACQLAPFMSTIVIKHAFLPKPEAMLVGVTLALIALTALALRAQASPAAGHRLAVGFGMVAGFALATKVTAAPIFVLPLFVLPSLRAVIIYALVSVAAFGLFFLPGIGAADMFIDWLAKILKGSGAYGTGPQTVIDVARYPDAVLKILKRPALKVPLILALLTLALVAWRHRRGAEFPWLEVRGLMGVTAAQVLHVLVVAKQPVAFYMIPSYMLAAPSVLLSCRLLWCMRPANWAPRLSGSLLGGLVLAVFAAAQANGLMRLEGQMRAVHETAMRLDNARFSQCARVFIYAASSPAFALFLADRVTGYRFSARLKPHFPANDFWLEEWFARAPVDFRNWDGSQDFDKVRADYPCLYLRGNRPGGIERFMKTAAPGLAYETKCSVGLEVVATVNVDCDGRVRR